MQATNTDAELLTDFLQNGLAEGGVQDTVAGGVPVGEGDVPVPEVPVGPSNEQRRDELAARWHKASTEFLAALAKIWENGGGGSAQSDTADEDLDQVATLLNAPAFATAANDGSFEGAFEAALLAVQTFEAAAEGKLGAARAEALARQQRTERAKIICQEAEAAPQSLDAEATETDRAEFGTAVLALTGPLQGIVSVTVLEQGEEALVKLRQKATDIDVRCGADRERRRQAGAALKARVAKASPDPGATESEKTSLIDKGSPITALPEVPTDDQLAGKADLAGQIESDAASLTEQVEERKARLEKAKILLARLAPEAAGLKPHDRAPTTGSGPILTDADLLLKGDAAKFVDWAQVTTWNDGDLSGLEGKIQLLEGRIVTLNKATVEQIAKVKDAKEKATAAIDAPAGRAFSPAQQLALKKLVDDEAAKTDTNLALTDTVVAELGKHAVAAAALSRALAGLAIRLAAVAEPVATSLSDKEKAALKDAKANAEKALNEVTEA
jgi:hypothetical protein